jgi:hypothetical protein
MPWECRVWAIGVKRVADGAEPMDMEEEAVDEEVAESLLVL